MKSKLIGLLSEALAAAHEAGEMVTEEARIEVEKPRQEGHGDLSTNLAMTLAKAERKPPRAIAETILKYLDDSELEKAEIAGPGFMNFTFRNGIWQEVVDRVLTQGDGFIRSDRGQGRKVQVEFVSANPTGPLHVGHGRGAAVGDALANLLLAAGYEVEREYYINDAGRQMLLLGSSVLARMRQAAGQEVEFPEDGYHGEYIRELAEELTGWDLDDDSEAALRRLSDAAAEIVLGWIKSTLEDFGIEFQVWFSEKSLHDSGRLAEILEELKKDGVAYEADGALWYRTEAQGDEKDRVLVKSNGDLTYFAADVAYHADKFQRGFEWVIDVWGADHHGYIPRMTAAVDGFAHGKMTLTCKLTQLVNLLRGGEPVKLSKRAGHIITLKEVVEEVGQDACRFIFLTRRSDSHLDFDLEVAKSQSMDNPVYYVQYAHARVASIERKAEAEGLAAPGPGEADLSLLVEPDELSLLKTMARFPEFVAGAAEALEPHRITYFLTDLASAFHGYYNRHRVITDDPALSLARLALVKAVQQVVRSGLALLGVGAPLRMDRVEDRD